MISKRGYALNADRINLNISLSLISKIDEILKDGEDPLTYSYTSNNNLTQITFKHMFNYYIFKGSSFHITINVDEDIGISYIDIFNEYKKNGKFDMIIKGGKTYAKR